MLRYAFWGLLGALALGSMLLPAVPATGAAAAVEMPDLPALSMTLSH